MELQKKPSRTLLEPEYFSGFHCLADACKNDCCHGWVINVPRPCYMKIRSTRKSPELDALVREAIVRDRKAQNTQFFATMKLNEHGDCRFLNEQRLCSLQIECGHGVLPNICREFPRCATSRNHVVRRSCSTACEAVVWLLWEHPEGIRFRASELTFGVPVQNIRAPEGREHLYDRFDEIQSLTIRILQNRAYRLDERVILLGMALRKLAELEDGGTEKDVDEWLFRYAEFTTGGEFSETVRKLPSNPKLFLANNLNTFRLLSYNARISELFERMRGNLQLVEQEWEVTFDLARYEQLRQMLDELLSGDGFLLENVAVNDWFSDSCPLDGKHGVWQTYVRFCAMYSLLKFMLTASVTEQSGRDELVEIIVEWSRMLIHNRVRADGIAEEFHQNQSDSLAHMAVLVNG